jgi:cytochrome oxidase Cu insertion factor (SCO1/SenC/PrrC family)
MTREVVHWIFFVIFLLFAGFSASAIEIGEKAPDFELESTQGDKLKLSDLAGKNVLIQFYVLDFTPG